MSIIRKLGFILISFSLATLLSLAFLDSSSNYYGGTLQFDRQFSNLTNVPVASYLIVYLRNKETEVLVDLKESSWVCLTITKWKQTYATLPNASYFGYFNFTNSLDKKLGKLDQGLYLFTFYSNDKKQVARVQVIQSGLENDFLLFSLVLMLFGVLLVLSSFLFNLFFNPSDIT
ncbi:MAG: hypothetical protein ACP5M7_09080 [Thermoproteota archaeon]